MNFALFLLFVFLEKLIPIFPVGFSRKIATVMSYIFYYLIPIRKKTARKNLQFVFPEKKQEEINSIIKDTYRNLMIVIAELFYLKKWDYEKFNQQMNFSNSHLFNNHAAKKTGIIVLSAHFGNWEMVACGGSVVLKTRFNVIVKELTNRFIDKRVTRIRESHGNKMIEMKKSARDILTALKNNEIVAILGDQSASSKSRIKVKFFGKEITAFEGLALFALKMKIPVLIAFPVRNSLGHYQIDIKEINMLKFSGYSEDNATALTQEYFSLLEENIRNNPGHWLWFHKRFKNHINYKS
jgi:KDO2-lipid IV(A) lauroyltransferase